MVSPHQYLFSKLVEHYYFRWDELEIPLEIKTLLLDEIYRGVFKITNPVILLPVKFPSVESFKQVILALKEKRPYVELDECIVTPQMGVYFQLVPEVIIDNKDRYYFVGEIFFTTKNYCMSRICATCMKEDGTLIITHKRRLVSDSILWYCSVCKFRPLFYIFSEEDFSQILLILMGPKNSKLNMYYRNFVHIQSTNCERKFRIVK